MTPTSNFAVHPSRRTKMRGRSRTQLLLGVVMLAGGCALWMPPPPADLRPDQAAEAAASAVATQRAPADAPNDGAGHPPWGV